jgi:ubiquinone/menaquinone biosynthesis C-methylase UbiE
MVNQCLAKTNADVRCGNAQSLPYADNFFDGIYSIRMGFSYCKDYNERLSIVNEIYRCLRPGGWVLWDSPYSSSIKESSICWPSQNGMIRTRVYSLPSEEVTRPFEQSGFYIETIIGDFNNKYTISEGGRIIIVARK